MTAKLSKSRQSLDNIFARVDDILGAVALFLLVFGGFWAASGIGLPTGADELMQAVP